MALMLKQDEEISIPSTFTYRGNSINSIFGERIILDDSNLADEWQHPLFRAIVKYLFSPVTGDKQDYSDIERYLDEFLSVSYMTNAAEQTDGMVLNPEEYQKHVDFVWEKLQEITIGDLLVGAHEHLQVMPFGREKKSAIEYALTLMPGEGKEQKLSDINNRDAQEAWEKMVGFRIKHSKLVEVANAQDKPGKRHRVFIDFIKNLSQYEEHITIKAYTSVENAAREFGLGTKAIQGATPKDTKAYVDLEIDFRSMFEDEMRRDDILEGMPANEWLPAEDDHIDEDEGDENGETILAMLKEEDKFDVNEEYPNILIREPTKEDGKLGNITGDRNMTEKEQKTWDEVMDIIEESEESEPSSEKPEEESTTQEQREWEEAFSDEESERPDEELYDVRDEEGELRGHRSLGEGEEYDEGEDTRDEETEWTPEDVGEQKVKKPEIPWMQQLKERHFLIIQQAVYWQTYYNYDIAEWQSEAAIKYKNKQINRQGTAENKKKEVVHAPMGTRDEDKRIFNKEPTESIESMTVKDLNLVAAFNVKGSTIRRQLLVALNPSNGVVFKLKLSGYLQRESNSTNTDWEHKVWGVFYLEDITTDKKVIWGYSGVGGQKTTKVGQPGRRKGAWQQVPKTPSRAEELGRGEDRPHRTHLLQPGESEHSMPQTTDPDTGRHRMVNPVTREYPRETQSFKQGLKARGQMGFLQSGGSSRGEWGQGRFIVLMGYLRKQYRKIEEMIEDA